MNLAEKLKKILSSSSYTKKDVKKFTKNEFLPSQMLDLKNNLEIERKTSPNNFYNRLRNEQNKYVNWEKRNFLKKVGLGGLAFLSALAIAKGDVLINASGVFKDGKEYSLGGIPYRIVAASNASDESKAKADYVCDGTDDQQEIKNAIDDLPTQGGIIFLTEGTFNFSNIAPIAGTDKNLIIFGSGPATSLYLNYNSFFIDSSNIYFRISNLKVISDLDYKFLSAYGYYNLGIKDNLFVDIDNIIFDSNGQITDLQATNSTFIVRNIKGSLKYVTLFGRNAKGTLVFLHNLNNDFNYFFGDSGTASTPILEIIASNCKVNISTNFFYNSAYKYLECLIFNSKLSGNLGNINGKVAFINCELSSKPQTIEDSNTFANYELIIGSLL